MKSIVKLLASLAIVLVMVVSTVPAFALSNDQTTLQPPITLQPGQSQVETGHVKTYKKFGTWRGAALGALGAYAAGRAAHSPHSMRNAMLGAAAGAYLGHKKHYY